MGKRVSNKRKSRQKGWPARSLKTKIRAAKKIAAKKARLAAARRRNDMLTKLRERFGEL